MDSEALLAKCFDIEKQINLINEEKATNIHFLNRKYKKIKILILFLVIIFCISFLFVVNYLLFDLIGINKTMKTAVNTTNIVYITDTGDCYHSGDCSWLFSSKSVTINYAVSNGYRACSKCHPGTIYITYYQKEPNYQASFIISLIISCIIYFFFFFKVDNKHIRNLSLLTNCYNNNKKNILAELNEYVTLENMRTICDVPKDIILDEEFLPVGNQYYCYVTKYGNKYHHSDHCGGHLLIKIHSFKCSEYSRCKKCGNEISIPKWYGKYMELMHAVNKTRNL